MSQRSLDPYELAELYEAIKEGHHLGQFDLRGVHLGATDLQGADLSGMDLRGINLTYADLRGALLAESDLEGAVLRSADLRGADLRLCMLDGAILVEADLTRADLTDVVADKADFRQANLAEAQLVNIRANGAVFTAARLVSTNLDGAVLKGAKMSRALMEYTILTGVNLAEADLQRSSMRRAVFSGAKLNNANLSDTSVTDTVFTEANLTGATMDRAIGRGNDFRGAGMAEASLMLSDMTGAHFQGTSLVRANMSGARLVGSDFTGADLSGADLSGARLHRAILDGVTLSPGTQWNEQTEWPEDQPPFAAAATSGIDVGSRRSLGRATAPTLRFRHADTPRSAREYKRAFPVDFDVLKRHTGGRDFSDDVLAHIRQSVESPFEWAVTSQRYSSDAQRLCGRPNQVLLLNIRVDDSMTERQRKVLKAVRDMSERSGHPVASWPLFTIGWARYCDDEGDQVWLVEEVQSDVGAVRKGVEDPDFRRQLVSHGLPPEDVEEALDLLEPYAERFYEDALGILFELAAERGYTVEMLDFSIKRHFGSPMWVYTDLPRRMGMRRAPSQRSATSVRPETDRVWRIKPNRRASRRRSSRRRSSRRSSRKRR
jgi:uncharacterized protein YjbI with pentapeptide repeats